MPNADMERLWNALFPMAEEQLRRFGFFSPFAAGMRKDGIMVHVPDTLTGWRLKSDAVRVRTLVKILVQQAQTRTIRACCICYDTDLRTSEMQHFRKAIRCELESEAEEWYTADLPYALFEYALAGVRIDRKLYLGNPIIQPAAPTIFKPANAIG
jgi:hypothetical protein